MRKSKIAVFASCALLCLPHIATAATVSGPSGTVLINEGNGFQPLTGAADLSAGGRVMVRPGGAATIAYTNNCVVKVGSGVWTVQPTAPCANGQGEIDLTERMNHSGSLKDAPYHHHDHAFLIGGLIVGGGLLVGCIVSWCHDNGGSH